MCHSVEERRDASTHLVRALALPCSSRRPERAAGYILESCKRRYRRELRPNDRSWVETRRIVPNNGRFDLPWARATDCRAQSWTRLPAVKRRPGRGAETATTVPDAATASARYCYCGTEYDY